MECRNERLSEDLNSDDKPILSPHKPLWKRYLAAVLLSIFATVARLKLVGLDPHAPYVTFYPAVVLSAFYGGVGPGLLATALCGFAVTYWLEGKGVFSISDITDVIGMVYFFVSCVLIIAICEAMHRARARMAAAEVKSRLAEERSRGEAALRNVNEQLHRANEQLLEADQRKDEFLAMLAHELRNPLAPIRNAGLILNMTCEPNCPAYEKIARQRAIIERQVSHMSHLLDDLLDVSRMARGIIQLHKSLVGFNDVLTQAVDAAIPLIQARHHTLSVAQPPHDFQVEGDPDRLAQIVGNLLNNAAKYTEEGGQIWLTAGCEGNHAVVRVRDSGVGIAPELLPRVFDLFTQADQSLARTQGGLGIGLSMVKRLVELHGGTVEVHSAGLGQGSEFIVRLPLATGGECLSRERAT